MKSFLLILLFFAHSLLIAQTKLISVDDKLSAAEVAQVKGFIGNRLDNAYQNRILAQDINRLIEPHLHFFAESLRFDAFGAVDFDLA